MSTIPPILCVGEVLWDLLPTGQFIGGAPLNVAAHLRSLNQPAAIASRIGSDDLGRQAIGRLSQMQLSDSLVQIDPSLPTGRVQVTLIDAVTPTYTIERPAAWDAIELTDALHAAASQSRAMVFGSLAQRDARSRPTIAALLDVAPYRVFDLNLRPPFIDRETIEQSLRKATLLKLNEDELAELVSWFGLPKSPAGACAALCDSFSISSLCVTRAADGAALLHRGHWLEHPGYRVDAVDPVGAGDAFLATLLAGLLGDAPADETLAQACAVGAYVAMQTGATPVLDQRAIAAIRNRG